MKKRFLKIFGIVFGVAILVFGAIIGVMALQGKFKKPHVEPTALYFDLPYDEQSRSYYTDVTYYCNQVDTKGEPKSNVYSFTLRSEPDNTTELDCLMVVESGAELITFCDSAGEPLSGNLTNIKINCPVYYKLNNSFDNDTENYKISNGVVKIYFNSSNGMRNGYLTINIDRQVSSVSLKDITTIDSPNNVHKNGKFNFEGYVGRVVSLSSKPSTWENYYTEKLETDTESNYVTDIYGKKYVKVQEGEEYNSAKVYYELIKNTTLNLAISANDAYPLIPIYAPENSNQPFTSVDAKTCDIFIKNGNIYENVKTTTSSHIFLDDDGVYKFISSEPGEHKFYLVTYPTYEIQKQAEEFFVGETNMDNIIFNNEFAITREVVITVKNFGIESVQFRNNDEVFTSDLNLFRDNYFVLNDDSMGSNYTNLQIKMFNNKGFEETSRLNQIKFLSKEDFVEGKISLTASNKGTANSKAQILIDGDNAILTNFGDKNIDGTRKYELSFIQKDEDLFGSPVTVPHVVLKIIFNENESDCLSLIFKVLSINEETGMMKLETSTSYINSGNKLTFDSNEKFTSSIGNIIIKEDGVQQKVYSIGTIKVGSYLVFTDADDTVANINNMNGIFEISSSGYGASKIFKVLPKVQQTALRLYLFVINEDYSCIYTENSVTISVDSENTVYTKATEIEDLRIKYYEAEDKVVSQTSEIPVESLISINSGSYRLPLMFVKAVDAKVQTLDVKIVKNGVTYKLAGYIKNGKFVNSIKPLGSLENGYSIGNQDVYIAILKYDFGIKTSEQLAEKYLKHLLDENPDNDEDVVNVTDYLYDISTFDSNVNKLSVNIVFAETIDKDDQNRSNLGFVGELYNSENIIPDNKISDEECSLYENSAIHKFVVKINDNSAFKESNILRLFTGGDESGNLLKMGDYFNLSIHLYDYKNELIQTGMIFYYYETIIDEKTGEETIVLKFTTNNHVINTYFEIVSAIYDSVNNQLVFEFKTLNDIDNRYVGTLDETTRKIKGYYFQIEFSYGGGEDKKSVLSPKMVVISTAVTQYVYKTDDSTYDFNEYKVVYGIDWSGTDYSISASLVHKTSSTVVHIEGNLFNKIFAYPFYSEPEEHSYSVTSENSDIIEIVGANEIAILKTGTASITLTNTTYSNVKTIIDIEIITSSLKFNEPKSSIEINEASYSLADNIYFGTDSSNKTTPNLINTVVDNQPIVTFNIVSTDGNYQVKKFNHIELPQSINEYVDYAILTDKTYRKVATKPDDWERLDFANEHYYLQTDNGKVKIESPFINYTQTLIDWDNVDEADIINGYYFVKSTNAETLESVYVRITDGNFDYFKASHITLCYTATPTWQDGQVYQLYKTVASLRLYKTNDGYQWKLDREADYNYVPFSFKLVANSIVGSQEYTIKYLSAVEINRVADHGLGNGVITYYKGTNLIIASLQDQEDSGGNKVESLFKLKDQTNSNGSFKLEYREDGSESAYTELDAGTLLAFEASDTILQGLNVGTIYQARISFDENTSVTFKFKVEENLLYEATTNNKTNTSANPFVMVWGKTTSVDLAVSTSGDIIDKDYIKYYNFDHSNGCIQLKDEEYYYVHYSNSVVPSEITTGIGYQLVDTDKEYKNIITLNGTTLNLNWVQFAGIKDYAVVLEVSYNDATIPVVYYVQVQSDFSVEQIKDLPDLKALEETDFDIAKYFTIKNGATSLTINSYKITNTYLLVTGKPVSWDGYYVLQGNSFVPVENNATFNENERYYVKGEDDRFGITGNKLTYNYQVGGTYLFEIEFEIDDNGTKRKIIDVENGDKVIYEIKVLNYELPVNTEAKLVGDGETFVDFDDLFTIDWRKVSEITVDLGDNILSRNDLTITEYKQVELTSKPNSWEGYYTKDKYGNYLEVQEDAEVEEGVTYYIKVMLSLGARSDAEEQFTDVIRITLTYITGEQHSYDQPLTIVSAYRGEMLYSFNDLKVSLTSSDFNKPAVVDFDLPEEMNYDIALSNEIVDVENKFMVYKNADDLPVAGSKATEVVLLGGTTLDYSKVVITGTKINLSAVESTGYLLFKVSNELTSAYYLLRVTPASVGYESVISNNERAVINKTFRVGAESIDTTIPAINNITIGDNFSIEEIATATGLDEDMLQEREISLYLTYISDSNEKIFNEDIKIGDKINEKSLKEPKNPVRIRVEVVINSAISTEVHIMNYEILLLPNIKVDIAEEYENIEILNTENHYEYDMNISYSYTNEDNNIIYLSSLFTATNINEEEIDLSSVSVENFSSENIEIDADAKTIELVQNISADIAFDMELTYEYLIVTVHVTYKAFVNENTTRRFTLGWNGEEFDYTIPFSDLVPNYAGNYEITISGEYETFNQSTYTGDFSDYILNDANAYREIIVTLTDIEGFPSYKYDIYISEPVNKVLTKGDSETNAIETTPEENNGSKLDISVETKSGYTQLTIGGEAIITIRGESLKIEYSFTTLDGASYNEYITNTTKELNNSSTNNINFIESATDYIGKLVLRIDGFKDIELFVTVSQTYDPEIQYPVSSEEKETFVVGDNLTLEEFVNGSRFDYVSVSSDASWEEDKYYYFDKSSNKYLKADATYLFNRYRKNLYKQDSSNLSWERLSNDEEYTDSTTYGYALSGTPIVLSNTVGDNKYIFLYLFKKDINDYFTRQARENAEVTINSYVEISQSDKWGDCDYYIYDADGLEYDQISEEKFKTTLETIYKIVPVTVNMCRVMKDRAKEIILPENTLNSLQVEFYYNDGAVWREDTSKTYAELSNGIIYFKQKAQLKLVLKNGTGMNLEYYVDIEEAETNVDNITINKAVGGIVTEGTKDIEYISVTLSELKEGFNLAKLVYKPSDQNMFALYGVDDTNFIATSSGIISGSYGVNLLYEVSDKHNLIISVFDTTLNEDFISYDLYLITANGIVKSIRLYVTDVKVTMPEKVPTLMANTEGIKLSDLGLSITNKDEDINYLSGNYMLSYAGLYNATDKVSLPANNSDLIKPSDGANSEEFQIYGIEKQKSVTLYYDLKYKVSDGVYVVIERIEFPVIINCDVEIGGGEGFNQLSNGEFSGTLFLNNYENKSKSTTGTDGIITWNTEFEIDLITANNVSKYRDEYITYKNLLNNFEFNGDIPEYIKDSGNYRKISDYLSFEIIEDSYTDSSINAEGCLTIKHDKDGLIQIKVTQKQTPNNYRIYNLNIKSTVTVYHPFDNEQQKTIDTNTTYNSGNGTATILTLEYDKDEIECIKVKEEYTDSYYTDKTRSVNSLSIDYSYYVHTDIDYVLKYIDTLEFSKVEKAGLSESDNSLTVVPPSVPMDGNTYLVTYKIIFTLNGTEHMYLYTIRVKNDVNLDLTTNYNERKITVGELAQNNSAKLYLYRKGTDGNAENSLFVNASNIIIADGNMIMFDITNDGMDSFEDNKVYFQIVQDGDNYYIDLTKGVRTGSDGKLNFGEESSSEKPSAHTDDTTEEPEISLFVETLFSNSMTFDFVFVDKMQKELYRLTDFTMTASNPLTATNNKLLTDLFTASELGQGLTDKMFSLVKDSNPTSASEFNAVYTGTKNYSILESSIKSEKIITRTIDNQDYNYEIKSCVIEGETGSFYNNNLKVYYILTDATSFIEYNGYYYIGDTINSEPNTDYSLDLTGSLKIFSIIKEDGEDGQTKWIYASEDISINLNNDNDYIKVIKTESGEGSETTTKIEITITKDYLLELKESGTNTCSFYITVSGAYAPRIFEVRISLNFELSNN